MKERSYPFVPKLSTGLLVGEFWAVPLADGSFACGRVLQSAPQYPGASRVLFLAALLDWHSQSEPTQDSIAGAGVLAQGKAHVKAVRESGGAILGRRELTADGLEPQYFRSGLGDPKGQVLFGLEPIRPVRTSDESLPTLSLWGYSYIRALAEHTFLSRNEA
jgi:hypothetical protein